MNNLIWIRHCQLHIASHWYCLFCMDRYTVCRQSVDSLYMSTQIHALLQDRPPFGVPQCRLSASDDRGCWVRWQLEPSPWQPEATQLKPKSSNFKEPPPGKKTWKFMKAYDSVLWKFMEIPGIFWILLWIPCTACTVATVANLKHNKAIYTKLVLEGALMTSFDNSPSSDRKSGCSLWKVSTGAKASLRIAWQSCCIETRALSKLQDLSRNTKPIKAGTFS